MKQPAYIMPYLIRTNVILAVNTATL